MNPAVWVLMGTVITVLGTVAVAYLKNTAKSPESQTALNAGWQGLTGGLQTSLDQLRAADTDKTKRIEELDAKFDQLEVEMNTMKAFNTWLINRVNQLVQFIRDKGYEPPEEQEPRPKQ